MTYNTPSESDVRFIRDMNKGNGYSKEEVAQIRALKVGETWVNHDFGLNSHIITRVE